MAQADGVALDARLLAEDAGRQTWALRYAGRTGGDARFHLEIGIPREAGSFQMASATLRSPGALDGNGFLRALAQALEVGSEWPRRPKASELALEIVILGDSLSRGLGAPEATTIAGRFHDQTPGPWLVTKLFMRDGEAEVFLALNSRERRGELLMKEPEYGADVVAEFARLLP